MKQPFSIEVYYSKDKKMLERKACSLLEAFKPFHLLCKCFLLVPVNHKLEDLNYLSNYGIFQLIFILSLGLTACLWNIYWKIILVYKRQNAIFVVTNIILTSEMWISLFVAYFRYLTTNLPKLKKLFSKISSIDIVAVDEPQQYYSKIRARFSIQVLLLVVIYTLLNSFSFLFNINEVLISEIASSFLSSIVNEFICLQYINFICVLNNHYIFINNILLLKKYEFQNYKGLRTCKITKKGYFFEPVSNFLSYKDQQNNLNILRKTHYNLYEVASMLESIYGLHIVFRVTHSFSAFLFYYYVMAHLDVEYSKVEYSFLAVLIVWTVVDVVQLIILTQSCQNTAKSSNSTAVIVQKLLLQETQLPLLSNELHEFSTQLLHTKLNFTAYGLFRIDLSFLGAFFGTLMTYVIVIMQ